MKSVELTSPTITQKERELLMDPLQKDLVAVYSAMRDEALGRLQEALDAGDEPDRVIDHVTAFLDQSAPAEVLKDLLYRRAMKYAQAMVARDPVLGTIGEVDGLTVDLVNGNMVKILWDPDFVEGANHMAKPYVPDGHVWIDAAVSPEERSFVIGHETREDRKMRLGWTYDQAHAFANVLEVAERTAAAVPMSRRYSTNMNGSLAGDVRRAFSGDNRLELLRGIVNKERPLQDRREFQGLKISIENRKGSVRTGVNEDGTRWRTKFTWPYGYIRLTEGTDGDHVDCFIGPDEAADTAYVIATQDPTTNRYDEDKVMLGFHDANAAKQAFLENYDDGPRRMQSLTAVSMADLVDLLATRQGERLIEKAQGEVAHGWRSLREYLGELEGQLVAKIEVGEINVWGGMLVLRIKKETGKWPDYIKLGKQGDWKAGDPLPESAKAKIPEEWKDKYVLPKEGQNKPKPPKPKTEEKPAAEVDEAKAIQGWGKGDKEAVWSWLTDDDKEKAIQELAKLGVHTTEVSSDADLVDAMAAHQLLGKYGIGVPGKPGSAGPHQEAADPAKMSEDLEAHLSQDPEAFKSALAEKMKKGGSLPDATLAEIKEHVDGMTEEGLKKSAKFYGLTPEDVKEWVGGATGEVDPWKKLHAALQVDPNGFKDGLVDHMVKVSSPGTYESYDAALKHVQELNNAQLLALALQEGYTPGEDLKELKKKQGEAKLDKADQSAAVKAAVASTEAPKPLPSVMETTKLGGTTGAERVKFTDPDTGEEFDGVLKRGASPEHATEEHVANTLYAIAGVPAAESRLFTEGGKKVMVSKFLGNGKSYAEVPASIRTKMREQLQQGFVMDALLANWDVTGADFDNVLWDQDKEKAVRIDNGGSLRYRAQGAEKGSSFGATVPELETMRDPNKLAGKLVYKDVTDAMVQSQIKDVLGKADQILAAIPDPELKTRVSSRLAYLKKWKPKTEQQAAEAAEAKSPAAKWGKLVKSDPQVEQNGTTFKFPPLRQKHREGFKWYQGPGAAGNKVLREYSKLDSTTQGYVDAMDDYFRGVPEVDLEKIREGGVMRGCGAGPMKKFFQGMNFPKFSATKMSDLDQKTPNGKMTWGELIKKSLTGAIFFDQGYVSTSKNQSTAQGFMHATGEISENGGSVFWKIKGKAKAVWLDSVSHTGEEEMGEGEWLLPRGTGFRIEKVDFFNKGGPAIVLEVKVEEGAF